MLVVWGPGSLSYLCCPITLCQPQGAVVPALAAGTIPMAGMHDVLQLEVTPGNNPLPPLVLLVHHPTPCTPNSNSTVGLIM